MPRSSTKGKKATPITKAPLKEVSCVDKWAERFDALDIASLNSLEKSQLAICHHLCQAENGGFTPFEEFFSGLITQVLWDRRPSPDFVADALVTFRDAWENEIEHVRDFIAAYPDAIVGTAKKEATSDAA